MSCHFAKLRGALAKYSRWQGAFRQGRPLAEGQKARPSEGISQNHPPPPAKRIGGEGRIFREICRFSPLRSIIWRRGSNLREIQSLAASPIIRQGGRLAGLLPDWW